MSDLENPELMHRHIIGTRGTTSEATSNHLAFNYFRSRDALALPMAICEESDGGGDYGDVMTFNGLMVFDVSLDEGISEHGRIYHEAGDSTCKSWWTDSNSWVQRSIFMEDYVYSVAPDRINVSHLDDLSTLISSIELP